MDPRSFTLRPLRPEDGEAYAALLAASPDTGSIGMAERFEMDPYQVLVGVQGDAAGIVAEAPDHDGLVGGALARFGRCQWEGQVRPSALLNTVVVHPDFRRRGLASRLEESMARQFDDDGVFFAIIQRNNIGSERAAGRWASQILRGRLASIPIKMHSTRPTGPFIVRAVQPEDLAIVAERMNEFYRDYNLFPPESAASLADWLKRTPFETPFRHYRVVTGKGGSLLAGMAVTETCRLRTTMVTHMSALLRMLNLIFRVVPRSGQLRELTISRAWYAPGQPEAMRHLLEAARWEWREIGTTLVVFADVRGPMMEICRVRPWTGSMTLGLALRAPVTCSEDRLLYYA
jgi:GNAT superfamily N-acetyltransferase